MSLYIGKNKIAGNGIGTNVVQCSSLQEYQSITHDPDTLYITPSPDAECMSYLSNYAETSSLISVRNGLSGYVKIEDVGNYLTDYVKTVHGIGPTDGNVDIPDVTSDKSGLMTSKMLKSLNDMEEGWDNIMSDVKQLTSDVSDIQTSLGEMKDEIDSIGRKFIVDCDTINLTDEPSELEYDSFVLVDGTHGIKM